MATTIHPAVNTTLPKVITKIPRLTAKAPAAKAPTAKAPVTNTPAAKAPAVEAPVTNTPAAKAPAVKKERVVDPKNWESYILKLKKATRPDVNISKVTIPIINRLLLQVHQRVVQAAEGITVAYEYQTIDMKSIQAAVRAVFPKDLVNEVEAVAMAGCDNSDPKILNPPKRTRAPPKPKDPNAPPTPKAPKVAKPKTPKDPNAPKVERKPAQMRTDKAGLHLPIPRVEKLLREQIEGSTGLKRVGAGVPIYLTGALEGLCIRILNTGADTTLESNEYLFTKNHLINGIDRDQDLRSLFANWLLSVDNEESVKEEAVAEEQSESNDQPTDTSVATDTPVEDQVTEDPPAEDQVTDEPPAEDQVTDDTQ